MRRRAEGMQQTAVGPGDQQGRGRRRITLPSDQNFIDAVASQIFDCGNGTAERAVRVLTVDVIKIGPALGAKG